MKRRIAAIFTILLVISLIFYKYVYTNGVGYILLLKDSTALIVDDWFEIRGITSLYRLNYHFYDCCSETGDRMYFIKSPHQYSKIARESSHLYLYNNTSIDSLWERLTKKLGGEPSFFAYSLRIPSQYDRDSLIRLMINDGYRVVAPFDDNIEKPFLEVQIAEHNIPTHLYEKIVNRATDSLKGILKDIHLVDIEKKEVSCGIRGNKGGFIGVYIVKFDSNESLMKANQILKRKNFHVINNKHFICKTVWLFSKEKNAINIERALHGNYKIIEGVEFLNYN